MSINAKIISAFAALNLIYLLSKEKRKILTDEISPKEKSFQSDNLSILLSSAKNKLKIFRAFPLFNNLKKQQQFNTITNSLQHSKFFFISPNHNSSSQKQNDSELKLIQIEKKKESLTLFDKNLQILSQQHKSNYTITGVVTSEDKKNLVIIFKSILKSNVFILKYFSDLTDSHNYDEIIIEEDSPISSIAVKENIIIFSLLNSQSNFYILSKNLNWNKELKACGLFKNYELSPSSKTFTTSLKFYSKDKIIQTIRIIKAKEIQNFIVLHHTNSSEILSQFKEIPSINTKQQSFIQPVYSNGISNNEYLFEYTKGKLFYLNPWNELFLLNVSKEKIQKISSNERNIVIQYEATGNKSKFSYIHKTNEKYSLEKRLILKGEEDKILSFVLDDNYLIVLNKEGKIKKYELCRWYDDFLLGDVFSMCLFLYSFFTVIFLFYGEKVTYLIMYVFTSRKKRHQIDQCEVDESD